MTTLPAKLLSPLLFLLIVGACGDSSGETKAPVTPASVLEPATPANGTVHFVWLPSLQGLAEGIPCSPDDVPALPAAARITGSLREQGDKAILACIGDTLIEPSTVSADPAAVATMLAKTDVDLDAMAAAGVDIYVPGQGDMINGVGSLLDRAAERGIPVVISNVEVEGRDDIKPYVLVEHAGLRFAVLGVVAKQGTRVNQDDLSEQEGVTFNTPGRAVRQLSRQILKDGEANAIVCLSSLTTEGNQALSQIPNLHFLIGSAEANIDHAEVAKVAGTTMFLQPTAGRSVGVTSIRVVDDDWDLADISDRHVLPEKVAKEREVLAGLIETYGTSNLRELAPLVIPYDPASFIAQCEMMEENTVWLEKAANWPGSYLDHQSFPLEQLPEDDEIVAVLSRHGAALHASVAALDLPLEVLPDTRTIPKPEDCRSCHEAQFEFWAESSHASSYERLVAMGRENDSACLTCHTTGFGTLGGYRDPRHETPFGAVTCLHCHEVQDPHAFNKRLVVDPMYVTAVAEDMNCATCHTSMRDPGFDREAAIEAIACPPMRADDPVLLKARSAALNAIQRTRDRGAATDWDDYLEGRALVGMGRPQEGLPLVKDYIRGRTDWPQMTYSIAQYLEQNGDAEGSLELFKQYLEQVPGDLSMNIAYIELLATSDDPDVLDKEHALGHARLVAPPDAQELTSVLMPAYLAQVDILMETNQTQPAYALIGRLKERFVDNEELNAALTKYGLAVD